MFLTVNMTSLQLVTVNILAFRAEYGSQNPAEIIGIGILATLITTLVGTLAAKFLEGRRYG
jgi:spore maturation protein A